jgi:catechol 2,3-dioxygenase-like lactoylglutathione lyase family enzyme
MPEVMERPAVAFQSNSEVAIHVPDLARAEAFYGGVLGFRLVGKSADMLEFDTGALRLYVNRDPGVTSFTPSLDVKDFDAAKQRVLDAGCTILRESADGKGFYFQDPFGFTIDVIVRP